MFLQVHAALLAQPRLLPLVGSHGNPKVLILCLMPTNCCITLYLCPFSFPSLISVNFFFHSFEPIEAFLAPSGFLCP